MNIQRVYKGSSLSFYLFTGNMKRIILLIFFAVQMLMSYAQSGSIKITDVDHGYTKNGQSGINIHCKVELDGCKGIHTDVIAFFYEGSNGDKGRLLGGKSGYRTTSGHVCASNDITPRYDSSVFSDVEVFIPYSAIPHEHETHFSFYVVARDFDDATKFAESDWSNFHFTNTSNEQANDNNINGYTCYACGGSGMYSNWNPFYGQMVTFTCSACGGTGSVNNPSGLPMPMPMGGMSAIPVVPQGGGYIGGGYSGGGNSNGNYNSGGGSSRDCGTCHGTKTCNICGGNGRRVLLGTGQSGSVECRNCNGTGKCPWCNGSGHAR